jgi:hypothetical protein
MTADRGFNFCVDRAPADHAPDIAAQHRTPGEQPGPADRRAEQRPLAIAVDAGRLDVSVEIGLNFIRESPGAESPGAESPGRDAGKQDAPARVRKYPTPTAARNSALLSLRHTPATCDNGLPP